MLSNSHALPSVWMNHLYSLITETLSSSPPTTISLTHASPIIKVGQFPLAIPSLMYGCFKQDWWWPIKVLEWSYITALRMFWNVGTVIGFKPMRVPVFLAYWFRLWVLNQTWQSWDPRCMIYQNRTLINFRVPKVPFRWHADCDEHIWGDALQTWPWFQLAVDIASLIIVTCEILNLVY